jgi:peptide/nickel transport system permease protein
MRTSVYAKRKMLIYLAVFIALCIFSLVAGSFAPHDAELVNLLEAKKAPGGEYPMGTDWLGRCIFSRILSGASSSIFASLVIVVLSMLVGCATGLISGYVGGIVDEIMMRVVDVFLAFPGHLMSCPGQKHRKKSRSAPGVQNFERTTRRRIFLNAFQPLCRTLCGKLLLYITVIIIRPYRPVLIDLFLCQHMLNSPCLLYCQ